MTIPETMSKKFTAWSINTIKVNVIEQTTKNKYFTIKIIKIVFSLKSQIILYIFNCKFTIKYNLKYIFYKMSIKISIKSINENLLKITLSSLMKSLILMD